MVNLLQRIRGHRGDDDILQVLIRDGDGLLLGEDDGRDFAGGGGEGVGAMSVTPGRSHEQNRGRRVIQKLI